LVRPNILSSWHVPIKQSLLPPAHLAFGSGFRKLPFFFFFFSKPSCNLPVIWNCSHMCVCFVFPVVPCDRSGAFLQSP
jgi:hypothetical protein